LYIVIGSVLFWFLLPCDSPVVVPRHVPRGTRASATSLFAVFLSVRGDSRIPFLRDYITKSLIAVPVPDFDYRVLNYTAKDRADLHSLTPPSKWLAAVYAYRPAGADLNQKSAQMTAMDFFAFDHFLKHRNERWFLRACDDSIINFRALGPFLRKMANVYDPVLEPVIKGDCVKYRENIYIQGGSGLLCSRRAVELMAPRLDLFMRVMVLAEDTTIGLFAAALGFFSNASCSGAFLGHGPNRGFLFPRVLKYGRCPSREMKRWPFPRHLARVRDVVVYHKKDNSGRRLERSFKRSMSVFDAAEHFRWYSKDYFWPVPCMGTPELEGDDPII
jgi:hypothetical protein